MKRDKADLTNKVFGRLTVKDFHSLDKNNKALWKCLCLCGKEKIVRGEALKKKATKSCGCLRKESMRVRMTKHGERFNPIYHLWQKIKDRCYNENNKQYQDYGGRGIKMYAEWLNDPKKFINYICEYLGEKPSKKHSIDRIDNNGNYEPNNLRWATAKQQNNNRRKRALKSYYYYEGIGIPVKTLSEKYNINITTLRYRLFVAKWPIDKALNLQFCHDFNLKKKDAE